MDDPLRFIVESPSGVPIMRRRFATALASLALTALLAGPSAAQTPIVVEKKSAGKERTFLFTYAGTVKDLPPGKEARVWLPVAVSGPEQVVKIITQKLPAD